ncbi:MAG TPA: aspartate/glutamate racemase family protein [Synergistaceae bacterium]|nr:aspartate/glutamate racemase family protein [Synergistaceae bacterium]HPQ38509.1 aspartate/glutamate racemase family protein [Synergistaceae bacterium]
MNKNKMGSAMGPDKKRYFGYVGKEQIHQYFSVPKGQVVSGFSVGILLLDNWYPAIPGNVANGTTYTFPVRHRMVEGATWERINCGDPMLTEEIIGVAKSLQCEGCRVICGACGYFGHFHRAVVEALEVPVFLSSLVQVPLIKATMRTDRKVGIICADATALTGGIWESCGVDPKSCVVAGMPKGGEFDRGILHDQGHFDSGRICEELVDTAGALLSEHPEVGALLLECSDLPPYAAELQRIVGLPVYDYITMIKFAHSAVCQKPYEGFM